MCQWQAVFGDAVCRMYNEVAVVLVAANVDTVEVNSGTNITGGIGYCSS